MACRAASTRALAAAPGLRHRPDSAAPSRACRPSTAPSRCRAKASAKTGALADIAIDVAHAEPGRRIGLRGLRRRRHAIPVRVVRLDHRAGVGGAEAVAAPERRFQRQPVDALAGLQPVGDGRDDEFRLPVGAVEAEPADRVADRRVGEAPLDQRDNSPRSDGARHRRHGRDDLVLLELVEEIADQRLLHRLMHEMDVHQPGRIGDRRMAAVEDADLHQLEGRDVVDELHADLFQRRPPVGEIVLQHPLHERFAEHRPVVLEAEFLGEDRALAVGRRRRDAVDHGVRKGDVVVHPAGEILLDQLRQPDNRVRRDMAVVGDVVAGHDGEGRDVLLAPPHQPGEDQAEHGLRRVHVLRSRRRCRDAWG